MRTKAAVYNPTNPLCRKKKVVATKQGLKASGSKLIRSTSLKSRLHDEAVALAGGKKNPTTIMFATAEQLTKWFKLDFHIISF